MKIAGSLDARLYLVRLLGTFCPRLCALLPRDSPLPLYVSVVHCHVCLGLVASCPSTGHVANTIRHPGVAAGLVLDHVGFGVVTCT